MASTAGVRAGKAFVLIEAVDKTSFVLRRISAKMKSFASKMTQTGRSMMTTGIFAAAPIAMATKRFASFDDAMRRVEARSGATAGEMKSLTDQAKELGRTTSFTAVQVADLQAKLAQKGFKPKQIGDMTGAVMNLARAAGSGEEGDTTIAADLVSGTLKAFQMGADQAGRVSDIFTAAVNGSNFSLEGLMDGMAKAGPLASSFGLSVEETAATLASMTNLNITAAEAGTAFQSFLARMSKEEFTGSFNKQLEQLTGQTIAFKDAEGNLRKPLEVFADLQKATANLGTAERGDLLSILFGVRQFGKATGGMAGAVDAMKLLEDLQGSQGAAQEAADKMDAGIGGSFRRIMSAIEGLAISVGEALAPALKKVTELVTKYVGVLTKWIGENKGLVTTIGAIVGAVILIGGALMGLGFAVNIIAIAMGGLATVIALVKGLVVGLIGIMGSPFFLIAAAIAAAVAALYMFNDTFRNSVDKFVGWFAGKFGEIKETVGKTMEGVFAAIAQGDFASAWEIIVDGAQLVWLQFIDALAEAWSSFATFFVEVWAGVTNQMKKLWIGAQKFIANGIMAIAEQEGILGDVMDLILGVDVSDEKKRSAKLTADALALQLKNQQRVPEVKQELTEMSGDMVKQFKDFGLDPTQAGAEYRTKADEMMRQGYTSENIIQAGIEAGGGDPLLKSMMQLMEKETELKNIQHMAGMDVTDFDPLQDAVNAMNDDFDGKMNRVDEETGEFLSNWNQGNAEADRSRDEEIKKRKAALDALVAEVKARGEAEDAAEEAGEDAAGGGAGGEGGINAGGMPPGVVLPSLGAGLESGSVAAAQKAYENAQRKDTVQDKQLAVQENIETELITMNTTLGNLGVENLG